jgi:hypothetical protein
MSASGALSAQSWIGFGATGCFNFASTAGGIKIRAQSCLMESDGIIVRKAYPQVPPKVEYSLTPWGQALCPALDAILKWADLRH